MEEDIENISVKSRAKCDDDKSSSVTSWEDTLERKPEINNEEKFIHQSNIATKLLHYESECKRYSEQKIDLVLRSLREEPDLEDCNLDHYGIGSLQCQIMFETFTKSPPTKLTSISLKNNHIEHFCCHAITSFLQTSTSIKELVLDGCKFNDEGAIILSEGISISRSIVSLNLSNCNISDQAGEVLVNSFFINYTCQELNLSSNYLGLRSAEAFREVFTENVSLEKLDLSRNALYEDYAIVPFLKGLAQNKTLQYLDLSWNALYGEPFGKVLFKSVKSSKLKVLKFEVNHMSTFELKKLAIGLRFSKSIEEVYIQGNLFIDDIDFSLINVFNSKSSLKFISFGNMFHLSHEAFNLLKDIQLFKPYVKVIFQNVLLPNPPRSVNMLDIYADRVKYLAMSPKKKLLKKDMGIFMMRLKNLKSAYLLKLDFLKLLKAFKASKLDEELISQYIEACTDENKRLDVHLMANHYLNRHPRPNVELSQ